MIHEKHGGSPISAFFVGIGEVPLKSSKPMAYHEAKFPELVEFYSFQESPYS